MPAPAIAAPAAKLPPAVAGAVAREIAAPAMVLTADDTFEGKYDNDIDTLYDLTKKLGASLDNVIAQLDKIVETLPVYDPTQGKNVTSREAMRNMYRELAVFGARASELATISAAEAAQHTTLETAVIGNKTIFGHNEPRVTPMGE
jgi:hypothetical protein